MMPSTAVLLPRSTAITSGGDLATAQADAPYSPQAGQPKASVRRTWSTIKGGKARMMMDIGRCGIHHDKAMGSKASADASATPSQVVARKTSEPAHSALDARRVVKMSTKTLLPEKAGQSAAPAHRPVSREQDRPRPSSAPAELCRSDIFALDPQPRSDLLPERAIRQEDAPPHAEQRRRSFSTAGGNIVAPIRNAAAKVRDTLGSACDVVYEGMNAAGRGIKRAYGVVHDTCAALGRHAFDARPASGSASGTAAKHAIPPAGTDLVSGIPAVTHTINKALGNSATEIDLAGAHITYPNVLYLLMDKTSRKNQDDAQRGLKASNPKYNDPLMRGMATAMRNARNPENAVFMAAQQADMPKLEHALRQYQAYRDTRYPDFEALYQRLNGFGDRRTIDVVESAIAERRAACEAQGMAWDEDAYIGNEVLNPGSEHPVTALQFSEDLARMRGCLKDLAAHLDQLA